MKIQDTIVNFISKSLDMSESFERQELNTEQLVSIQDEFRNRIQTILSRAYDRKLDTFEMSGFDNRYPNFPVVGAAKIAAQEIMKGFKNIEHRFQTINIDIPIADHFELYSSTFEGYVRHMQNGLGKEPYATVDIIIELPEGIILIERSNPPYGWALPGGFIDAGEDTKQAAIREAKEETNMDLVNVRQFNVYGTPGRDPRFLTRSTVYIAKGEGVPQFGDDAKGLKIIAYEKLAGLGFAFDHKQIISDYMAQRP